jgi:hypothetical protein
MNVLRAKATSLSFDAISRPENRKACRTALLWVELLGASLFCVGNRVRFCGDEIVLETVTG